MTTVAVSTLSVGLFACLQGTFSIANDDLTFSGVSRGYYGWTSVSGMHAGPDLTPDLAIAAPNLARVYFYDGAEMAAEAGGKYASQTITDATHYFEGDARGEAGWSLAVGNLTGAKSPDLWVDTVIGAPGEAQGRGVVYVVSGGQKTASGKTYHASFRGEEYSEWAGWSLAVGDFDGDHQDDVAIGACGYNDHSGRVFVVHGPIERGDHHLGDADVIIEGEDFNAQTGCTVAAGDLDSDGRDELVVGSRYATDPDAVGILVGSHGRVDVLWDLPNGSWRMSDLNRASIYGDVNMGFLGYSLDAGMDVSGDGVDDLVAGAPSWSPADGHLNDEPGKAFLFLGKSGGFEGGLVDEVSAVEATGDVAQGAFGASVALVNGGDGIADVLVGAPHAHKAYLFYGYSSIGVAGHARYVASDALAIFDGSAYGTAAGWSVGPTPDLNGDGGQELLVTALGDNDYAFGQSRRQGYGYLWLQD